MRQAIMTHRLLGYGSVALAALLWGSTGVFIKLADLSVAQFCFLRMITPVLFTLPFIHPKHYLRPWRPVFILISAISAIRLALQVYSFSLTSSIALTTLCIYTWPLCHALFLVLLKKEQPSTRKMVAFLVAFLGIACCITPPGLTLTDADSIAAACALLSAVLVGINVHLIKEACQQQPTLHTLCLFNAAGALATLPVLGSIPALDWPNIAMGLGYGLLAGTLGFAFFFKSLKRIPSSDASLVSYVEVPSGIFLGLLLFEQALTPFIVAGSCLIFISLVLILTQPHSLQR